MMTAAAPTSNINILSDLRHSLIDLIYSTTDTSLLEGALALLSTDKKPKYSELVSPSHDEWFDDPENIKMLDESIAEAERGETVTMTMDEIQKALGL